MSRSSFCRRLVGEGSFRVDELVALADFADFDATAVLRLGAKADL
ncbi:hypothetical protein [Cellulosimicrobium cellulans]|nr:hypothetical protein [Cellulosimicrobium cellulans]